MIASGARPVRGERERLTRVQQTCEPWIARASRTLLYGTSIVPPAVRRRAYVDIEPHPADQRREALTTNALCRTRARSKEK